MKNFPKELNHERLRERVMLYIIEDDMSKGQVQKLLKEKYPELNAEQRSELIADVFTSLAAVQEEMNNPAKIIQDHIGRYEMIYKYFKEIGHAQGANKALWAKERLLNIIKDNNKVTLKKSTTVVSPADPFVDYDLTKLSPEEKEELEVLLKIITVE